MAAQSFNTVSCLQARGTEERENEIVRNDYQRHDNEYSATHSDALSNGDPQGKGTGHGGHGHWLPNCSGTIGMIDYSNFDTFNGGGQYDIEGRNGVGGRDRAMASSLYSNTNEYNVPAICAGLEQIDGQYYMA